MIIAMTDPLSIREAAAQGIERLRSPMWAGASHLKIDIIDGEPGPWTHLYDPMNICLNGRDPVDVLFLNNDYDSKSWLKYEGPTKDSLEYKTLTDEMNND